MKLLTTLRNNWKKSVFGASLVTYGTYYLIERKYNGELMQEYCYEALKYSKQKVTAEHQLKRVIVFLNPIANKERGRFLYDKNVAPLFNLSGIDVRLVRLEKNSEANEYMKEIDLNEADCIVVAGGNATLNEVISGLLHRKDAANFLERVPIGIIPIGESNTFAHKWLNMLGIKRNTETEIRLLANAAMAIIKGDTITADLVKITLKHNSKYHVDQIMNEHHDKKNRGAYSLLKEDKIYALSNVSCGFVTETDANLENFRYFWRLKNYMNRYFMNRYLRRDPVMYEFSYKAKCFGCSKCLDEGELKKQLDDLVTNRDLQSPDQAKSSSAGLSSIMKIFYTRLVSSVQKQTNKQPTKEQEEAARKREKQKQQLQQLLDRSKAVNDECGKTFRANLTQVQIISEINEPDFEHMDERADEPSAINTVIVKDPEFNPKQMFLADKKLLKEFEIRKLHSNKPIFNSKVNSDLFSIEIDGEIYKLINTDEIELSVKVKLLEKHIKLIRWNPQMALMKVDFWPKIYLISKKTFSENSAAQWTDAMPSGVQAEDASLRPNILPFEKYYLRYWKTS